MKVEDKELFLFLIKHPNKKAQKEVKVQLHSLLIISLDTGMQILKCNFKGYKLEVQQWVCYIRGAQTVQKSRNHLKIQGASDVICNKLHTEIPQMLGTVLTYSMEQSPS
jgi:hypothetical protein